MASSAGAVLMDTLGEEVVDEVERKVQCWFVAAQVRTRTLVRGGGRNEELWGRNFA